MGQSVVLVVDDDDALREALGDTLTANGIDAITAKDGADALLQLEKTKVDLVVSDVEMRPVDGWGLLENLRSNYPAIPVLLMTAFGSIEQAVRAMQIGAADYLAKPFEVDALLDMVGRHLPSAHGDEIVAHDPRSLEVLSLARKLAGNELTVMISGESGTGKEVFARYIHAHSSRCDGPFVAINCAAIPENMLEAVLFGHEKGAFTGAHASHVGKFEQAQHGTLLLDEISEMGQALQAKLLRVLQEREVERLGGRKTIALDVRVLATTNRNLRDEVNNGQFREDLFYRLNVLPLALPPLRERVGDIMPLVERTLRRSPARSGLVPSVAERAAERLKTHRWPGNVRELENLVQRALVLADGSQLDVEHLMFENGLSENGLSENGLSENGLSENGLSENGLSENGAFENGQRSDEPATISAVTVELDQSLAADLRAREREVICEALRRASGNRVAVAAKLRISERTLRHKLARIREEGGEIPGELPGAVA